MSTRPNFIPRTLVGVGGVRLFDHPGIIYPKEMLQEAQHGEKNKDRKHLRSVPVWGISTKDAAEMLGCSPSAARLSLTKKKVNCSLVGTGGLLKIYWRRSEVEKIAQERLSEMRQVPSNLVSAQEAGKVLGIARSTLQRYEKRGRLHAVKVRFVLDDGGSRVKTFYSRREVEAVAKRLAVCREWEKKREEMLAKLE